MKTFTKVVIAVIALVASLAYAQEIVNQDAALIKESAMIYVSALREDNLEVSYAMLSDESRKDTTFEEFKDSLDKRLMQVVSTSDISLVPPEVVEGKVVQAVILTTGTTRGLALSQSILVLFMDVNPNGTWGVSGTLTLFDKNQIVQTKGT